MVCVHFGRYIVQKARFYALNPICLCVCVHVRKAFIIVRYFRQQFRLISFRINFLGNLPFLPDLAKIWAKQKQFYCRCHDDFRHLFFVSLLNRNAKQRNKSERQPIAYGHCRSSLCKLVCTLPKLFRTSNNCK